MLCQFLVYSKVTQLIQLIYPYMYIHIYIYIFIFFSIMIYFSFQFSSVTQLCPTLCDPMDSNMPGFPVHHQLPELIQTHIHRVGDAIHPSHLLSSLLFLPSVFPSLTSIHDYWKTIALTIQNRPLLTKQCLCFLICCLGWS